MQTGLKVEINAQFAQTNSIVLSDTDDTMTIVQSALNEDYWVFRIALHEDQAIIAFPKFSTLAISFAQEEDWNTNLPYIMDAQKIYEHIKCNKKYDEIADAQCLEAISLLQQTIAKIIG